MFLMPSQFFKYGSQFKVYISFFLYNSDINPFPAAVAYSTCAVYARNKYFCFLHKCCCQPITNIFALDLDTNTYIRSRTDLSLRSRSNSRGLDLEPWPSLTSRSNGGGLDLEPQSEP